MPQNFAKSSVFTLLLSYAVPVKSKVKILQNFVAFSEYMYMNFNSYYNFLLANFVKQSGLFFHTFDE